MEIITALIAGIVLACIIGFTQSYIGKIIKSNESKSNESTIYYNVALEDLEKFEEAMINGGHTYKEVKWFEITIKKDTVKSKELQTVSLCENECCLTQGFTENHCVIKKDK